MDLSIFMGGVRFNNPVMTGSGTYGYGDEYEEYHDPSELGAVLSKGLTLEPRDGNPAPRLYETASGLLNSVGLQNIGIRRFLDEKAPLLGKKGITIIANISGHSMEEFQEMSRLCDQCDHISAVEVNVSCPNVKEGGMLFGINRESVRKAAESARKNTKKPVIVKLSPNVTSISEMAEAAAEGGADGVTVANTLLGMAIDRKTGMPVMKNIVAGLSGPAVKPVILRMVYEVKRDVPDIPVIASGGISSWDDALEYIFAGATAFQLGTAMFRDPALPKRVLKEMERYFGAEGLSSLDEIVGKAQRRN